jgi:hypothetical protein
MPKHSAGRRSRLRTTATAARRHTSALGEHPIPLVWLKAGIGVLLLPICLITTQTFLGAFTETSVSTRLIGSAPLWFFFIGVALWMICFWGLPRPLYLYVLGHELTHAVFVILCGGKISGFKVRPEGGHIITNKNNLLISLSPYFVPFYSVLVVAAFGLIGLLANLSEYYPNSLFWGHVGFSWSWVFYIAVGATWCFHLTFTGWMILKNQPDLRQNGTFFSLTIIYLVNLLVLSAFLIIVSREISAKGFVFALLDNASAFFKSLFAIIK